MAKAIRDVYGETLKKYGAMNENIVVLDADVSGSTKSAMFGKEYPDRFYNCGISEYAMMGMAAGMAKNGKIPFVNTFAVFLTTLGSLAARTFMSYSGLPIKMMGGYGGLSDAFDGRDSPCSGGHCHDAYASGSQCYGSFRRADYRLDGQNRY